MSQRKPEKKKVVSTRKKVVATTTKKRVSPTTSRSRSAVSAVRKEELLFGKQHYILMGVGFGLVLLGLLLMLGGSMPSPDVWDESIIYGFRRTVLAPIVILAGLIVEIYAIFKK